MNKTYKSLIEIVYSLDKWSDETIKNSFIGKFIISLVSKIRGYLKSNPSLKLEARSKEQEKSTLFPILLFSICFLFASLSFPQFANDRFGIGLIIIFCFCIFLLNLFFSNTHTFIKFNSFDFLLLFFLLISTVSTFSSYFLKESLIGLLKYLVFILFYFFIKVTILNCSKKTFLNLLLFLFLSSMIIASIGIYQYFIGAPPLATWEDPTIEGIHTRAYSTLGNPNLLAGYLLLIFPIGLALLFETRFKSSYAILYLIGSCLIVFCLIFTGSRGGYLGLIAEIIFSVTILSVFFIKSKKLMNKNSVIIFLTLSIMIVFLGLINLFPHVTERILTIFTLREHSSNNFRVNVWLACLKMLKDNWILGIGPGNGSFRLAYGLYMVSGFEALAAYNIFLEFAIEVGILGCLIFVFIFAIFFIKLHHLFWAENNILALGIFISLVGLIIHGMVDTVLFRTQVFVPFWFLLASIGKLEVGIEQHKRIT